jgi:hypothetical protein
MLKMKVIEVREYPRQGTADVTLEYGAARKKLTLEMVGAQEFQLGQELQLVPVEIVIESEADEKPAKGKKTTKKDDDA